MSNHIIYKASIIIITYNQVAFTKMCVESILTNTHFSYELILVDNGSNDGTVVYLSSLEGQLPHIKTIFNRRNCGFAPATNQGIQLATGEFIILLNNDTLVPDSWLHRLLSCCEANPEIGLVGPKSNYVKGIQSLTSSDIKYLTPENFFTFAKRWFLIQGNLSYLTKQYTSIQRAIQTRRSL